MACDGTDPPSPAAADPRRSGRAALALGVGMGLAMACAMAWFESGRVGSWFFDPDDALRLVMVRDWLAGQPWGDVWQHRLQPGGTEMHWSRVDDVPLAAAVVALRGWLGQDGAERVAMLAWPLALVPVVAGILAAVAGPSPPRVSAAVLTACSGALLYRFMPGRIDHHAIMTTAALAACCPLLSPRARGVGWGAVSGVATALCLSVGFEDLAVLAALGVGMACLWAFAAERDRPLGYGVGLAGGMAVAEAAFVPWDARLATACDCLSGGWAPAVALAGSVLALAAARGGGMPRRRRVAALACMALGPAAVLAATGAGKCLAGPYPGLSVTARIYWLAGVAEMRDVVTVARGDWGIYATQCLAVALAAMACAVALARGRRPSPAEACYVAALAVAAALGASYVRNSGLPVAMAAPLVARAVPRWPWRGTATWAAGGALLAVSAVPGGLLVAEMRRDGATAAAVMAEGRLDCASRDSWVLAAAFPAGKASAPVDLGPEVLAYTPHTVLAAGIHRAGGGIDEERTLMTGTEAQALGVVERADLDYVFWCDPDGSRAAGPGVAAAAPTATPGWLQVIPGDGPVRVALVVKYKARKAWLAFTAPLPAAPSVTVPLAAAR